MLGMQEEQNEEVSEDQGGEKEDAFDMDQNDFKSKSKELDEKEQEDDNQQDQKSDLDEEIS